MGALNLVTSTSGDLSHQSAMDHLADLTLRRGCISTEVSSESLRLRSSFADDIEFIKSRAPASPVDTSKAVNIQQRCEMYHLTLQFAFVKAWVCRPALRKVTLPESTEQLRLHLVNLCLQSLRECLYAFVSLQALSSYATRSWSVIHNGLSSALLLALMGEARNDAPLQQAFEDLLAMFQDHQSSADDGPPVRCETSTLSAVHSRAVVILQKMCASEDGSRYMLGRPDPAFDYTGGSGESQAQETSGPLYVSRTSMMSKSDLRRQFHSNPVNPETTENADPYRTSLFETEPSLADLPPLDAFDSIWYV